MSTAPPPSTPTNATPIASADDSASFWRRLRAVVFWSVVIGIALELILLAIAAYARSMPSQAQAFAQVASKITWSSIVCIGIACGLSLANSRERVMGLLGAVSGPIGFAVARSVHKGTLQAIANAPEVVAQPEVLSPFVLAGIKVVEYGVFGYWLGRVSRDERAPLTRFLRAGLVIGVVFGSTILFALRAVKPEALPIEYVSKGINEMVFPIGCSLVLFVARKAKAAARVA